MKLFSRMLRLIVLGVAAPLLLLAIPVANAQISGGDILSAPPDNPQEEMRRAIMARIGQSGLLALEGAIDPNEYLIGPGDVFQVMIGHMIPIEIPLTVSVSGVLSLPEVGPIQASGRSLAEVQKEAIELLESHYANAPVSLSLTQARNFYVHVTGTVTRTGRYLVLPISRVSDVIQQALSSGVLTARETVEDVEIDLAMPERIFRPEINEVYKPALRNIRVQHIDGTEDLIDFTRYQTTGSTDHNPILRDGDRINVPAYHIIREGVRVSGDVAWPGVYDWRPDDTVTSILDLATGGRPLDETIQFRVIRWSDGNYLPVLDHNIKSLEEGSPATQLLMPGDHITVYERETDTAQIQGWVTYPGTYRIEGGVTTLTQLVELAGGLKEGANTNAAILERTNRNNLAEVNVDPAAVNVDPAAVNVNPAEVNVDHAAVNIAGALAGNSEDVVLYNGDRISFPRDAGVIRVAGYVPRPRYVPFVPGMPAHHYVERVGGMRPESGIVYVYDGGSSVVRQGLNEPVRPGDTIFVDQVSQLRLSRRQERIQLFFSSLFAAISISSTVIALSR